MTLLLVDLFQLANWTFHTFWSEAVVNAFIFIVLLALQICNQQPYYWNPSGRGLHYIQRTQYRLQNWEINSVDISYMANQIAICTKPTSVYGGNYALATAELYFCFLKILKTVLWVWFQLLQTVVGIAKPTYHVPLFLTFSNDQNTVCQLNSTFIFDRYRMNSFLSHGNVQFVALSASDLNDWQLKWVVWKETNSVIYSHIFMLLIICPIKEIP